MMNGLSLCLTMVSQGFAFARVASDHAECTKPSHSQSLANVVANFQFARISAARTKFSPFHSQNIERRSTGRFPNRGVSHFLKFFGKSPDCVAKPFGTVPRRRLKKRPRKRKRTNRANPRRVPGRIGKSRKNRVKDKKGQKSPDRETPPLEPPSTGP